MTDHDAHVSARALRQWQALQWVLYALWLVAMVTWVMA